MASLTYFITLTTDSCGFKVLSMPDVRMATSGELREKSQNFCFLINDTTHDLDTYVMALTARCLILIN